MPTAMSLSDVRRAFFRGLADLLRLWSASMILLFATVVDGLSSVEWTMPAPLQSPRWTDTPPPSLTLGAFRGSDPSGYGIVTEVVETRGALLEQDLTVDMTGPGESIDGSAASPGVVHAGTRVNSYLLHYDPLPLSADADVGLWFFDRVLGVILTAESLSATDAIFGAPTTTYPTGDPARGLEAGDKLILTRPFGGSSSYLWLNLHEDVGLDQIRVLTAAVPEPESIISVVTALAILHSARRRRKIASRTRGCNV